MESGGETSLVSSGDILNRGADVRPRMSSPVGSTSSPKSRGRRPLGDPEMQPELGRTY
jgi:hypothetical protein